LSNERDRGLLNKEIEDLKAREKVLNDKLREKDKTISNYNELMAKLKKKLTEKY
jgi:prefoldin subunit 5